MPMIRKTVVQMMLVLALLTLMMAATAQAAATDAAAQDTNVLTRSKAAYTNQLRSGMSGKEVRQYQGRLILYGYLESESGVFDNRTILATRYFQSANKIKVNGVATAKTRALINKDKGVVSYANYERAQQTAGFRAGAFSLGVELVQQRLKDLGYYKGSITGKCSADTAKAIVKFKQFNNFKSAKSTVTGADRAAIASESALSYDEVYGSDTIKPGESGYNVMVAQVILRELGYYKGSINGKYGRVMIAAVKKMQKANKLYPTGWLYSTSMVVLDKYSEKAGDVNARAYVALDVAQDQLGKKYKSGTAGPNTFDCSGFTYYVFKKTGKTLGQTALAQSKRGKLVADKANILPGDLVFFATGKSATQVNHVGLVYEVSGSNIRFVHASSTRGKVMTSSFMDSENGNFYNKRFRWARRMW